MSMDTSVRMHSTSHLHYNVALYVLYFTRDVGVTQEAIWPQSLMLRSSVVRGIYLCESVKLKFRTALPRNTRRSDATAA